MRVLIFFLFAIHSSANADTCIITDEMMEEVQSKYYDHIEIETSLVDSKYLVTINLPREIENQKLYSVFFASDNEKNPSFVAPLEVIYAKEKVSTWYQVEANQIKKHFIIVGVKGICAPSIIKEVSYK